jgi:uncharacterized membrane protein YciS (DUF1049 family)
MDSATMFLAFIVSSVIVVFIVALYVSWTRSTEQHQACEIRLESLTNRIRRAQQNAVNTTTTAR